jgi:hypothetical protein
MIFETVASKFHLRLKDRVNAANILAAALLDELKKSDRQVSIVLGNGNVDQIYNIFSNRLHTRIVHLFAGQPHLHLELFGGRS